MCLKVLLSTAARLHTAVHCTAAVVVLFVTLVSAARISAEETTSPVSDVNESPVTKLDRQHWAFSPAKDSAPPEVSDPDHWVRNGIDRFVLQQLTDNQLTPSAPAPRRILIRRVTFDLTGLPPTPDDVRRFVQDDRPDAWERLIDRLLATAAYGERWAQHWLDLARFAETDGFEHDLIRPNAWRYRDWVIDALNSDMPYDEFVRRQVAGDLLEPQNIAAGIPTGFLLCGPDMPDINLQQERRHNVLNEMTATTSAALLGLQMGCAQCHNHMFDPISQADFYRFRAFFESTEWSKEVRLAADDDSDMRDGHPGPSAAKKDPSATARPQSPAFGRIVSEGPPRAAHLMIRGDFRRIGPELKPAFPRIAVLPISTEAAHAAAAAANEQPESVAAVGSDRPDQPPRVRLANWLTQADHPLTTRVIVNRLWQFHFGQGLVRTPNDFGTMGDLPSHAALLDWLAAELPRRGWSLKQMHRLMLTSATWRQSTSGPSDQISTDVASETQPEPFISGSEDRQAAEQIDPQNRLLWRMNRQRLDGESIRDALLFVSGRLNRQRGGPGVRPPLPPEIVATLLKNQWQVTPDPAAHDRRSIYLFVRRNLRFPLFEAYDRPDTNASCPVRSRSTIAPQALVLLNSDLSLQAARSLAGRILEDAGELPSERIALAFEHALSRTPEEQELRQALQFLEQQSALIQHQQREPANLALPTGFRDTGDVAATASAAAFTDFCLALFNLNEFVYLD